MSKLPWVRVSNATQDPQTKCSVAQDQIVKIVGDDGDWYNIQTIDGVAGRVPKVLTLPIADPDRKPGQFIYCSTDAYTSIRSDDLSFAPSSLFVASPSQKHDGYLEGYLVTDNGGQLGSSGLLPEGYLTRLTCPTDKEAPPTSSVTGMTSSFTTNFNEDVKFRNYSVSPYARAIYDFQGEFENELSFSADEMINLRRRIDADWLEGSIGSARVGIFPASFVQIIVNLPDEDDVKSTASSLEKRRSTVGGGGGGVESDGIGFANIKHEFIGRQADELSVRPGDTVRVLKMVNDEWVMCKDPDTERTGIVPVGFLEVYLDDEDDDMGMGGQQQKRSTQEASFSSLHRNSFVAPSNLPDWKTSTRLENPMMIHPTTTTPDWNTTFDTGRRSVTNQQWATFGEDWIAAEQTPKTSAPARPPPPRQSSIQSPNDVVSVTEMFGMIERQAPPRPNAPSSMFQATNEFEMGLETATAGAATDEEKKQKILEELINSEIQFITDVNSYTEAVEDCTILNNKQKVVMKNGCAQIVQLSTNLVQLLTNEQINPPEEQNIGTCFLQLRKPFAQTYGYYFRNIENINQLLKASSSKKGNFENQSRAEKTLEDALKEIVQRMRESGAGAIDGATVVGRPVQRCLKYPLFLNEIVKLTPLNHPDHPKLLEAVKTMSNLGQKMNESKRRKELTRKYMAEDRSTIGEKLSKMTLHSLKKKSNRFTYRMGSSLGVVKLLRDVEFDNLVCELDSAERRLVRFNYMLVIYRKKMFHETRVLLHKKVVEPRKKAVSSSDADHQLYLFNEAVRDFATHVNARVRDEIVKALRNIPKRLIKKRNDKLMDYEASKSKERGNSKRDFVEIRKDYEALNSQVKQELPKTIEYLNKVLTDAMKVVAMEDAQLMAKMKNLFDEAKRQAAEDPSAQTRRLILPSTPFFVAYYDPDRLKPLQRIANKAAQSMRTRARSASPVGGGKASSSISTLNNGSGGGGPSTSLAADTSTNGADLKNLWLSSHEAVLDSSTPTPEQQHKFRAQTAEERKTILEKATAKGRLNDMFIATSHYPQDSGMLKLALSEGKLLIVRQGDLVLAVNREVPSMWLCYNGYYNAMLPSGVLRQYKVAGPAGPAAPQEVGVDVVRMLAPVAPAAPVAVPAQPQKSQNLIDLEDIFGAGPAALAPSPAPSSSITEASSSIFAVDWKSANFSPPQQHAPPPPQPVQQQVLPAGGANYNLDDANLFDGLSSIDWGSSTKSAAVPAAVDLMDVGWDSVAPAAAETTQRSASAAAKPTSVWPMTSSSMMMRSESPQPLIPSRPAPAVKSVYPQIPAQTTYDFPPMQPTATVTQALYEAVPAEQTQPLYDQTPMFGGGGAIAPAAMAGMYDTPPPSQLAQQYDQPPLSQAAAEEQNKANNVIRPVLCEVRVDYDFVPQGSNQVAVTEAELVGVLQRTDDDGNPEWLLVKRSNGQVGYVPAAYCRPV